MNSDIKPFDCYTNGNDMWRDIVLSHGVDEAITICADYLDINLKREHSDNERLFCRELFTAVYEATASKTDPTKLVYPYSYEEADKRMESSYYYANRRLNDECARAIDTAIHDSNYKQYYYNLENAVWKLILCYGFSRLNAVLAHQIQIHEYDSRYSQSNIEWATSIISHNKAFDTAYIHTHATLVDDFVKYTRILYADLKGEQFALPGSEEHGEYVNGYQISRTFMLDDERGYAIAHNTNAFSSFACWQFILRNGERHYNRGIYGNRQTVEKNYIARVLVALN